MPRHKEIALQGLGHGYMSIGLQGLFSYKPKPNKPNKFVKMPKKYLVFPRFNLGR